MKPVYLEFSGVNSFSERAEIDFEKLLEFGIFGIFGDTGSGKSTILDWPVRQRKRRCVYAAIPAPAR